MSDLVIKMGDMIRVTIPPPTVVPALVAAVPLVATGGQNMVDHQSICLEGDELPPALRLPLPYTAPPFVTPGMGTLSVTLTPANKTIRTRVAGKAALIKGSTFSATFTVSSPAMQPTPTGAVPDPLLSKVGTAQFVTTTTNVRFG